MDNDKGEFWRNSFGLNDERLFGGTQGSVIVFADIPENCEEGEIEIETKVPEVFYGNQTLYSNLIFIHFG